MKWKRPPLLIETTAVVVFGLLAASAANHFSPRGLLLTRDYFPGTRAAVANAGIDVPVAAAIPAQDRPELSAADSPAPVPSHRNSGIATLTTTEAAGLFHAPEYEQELTVFVDARSARHFEAGHIPGAYPLERYRPENDLGTVLPACLGATRVVVYCTGGECEDSHFAAELLRDAGVPTTALAVYTGGIAAWEAARLPVEIGPRRSGELKPAQP